MKRLFFLLVLIPFALGALPVAQFWIDKEHPENIEGVELLLTYPRSGTNWITNILQILTQRHVRFFDNPFKNQIAYNRLNLTLDDTKPVMYRSHIVQPAFRKMNQDKNKLVATLRNYKECIVQECKYDAQKLRNSVLKNFGGFRNYIENLKFFDLWWANSDTKHLLIYEDLITKPRETIEALIDFLEGETPPNMEDFFAHYDEWSDRVKASYDKQHKRRSSGGDKLVFHSKDFPLEIVQEIDTHIKNTYPDLWEKYLWRYETVSSPSK